MLLRLLAISVSVLILTQTRFVFANIYDHRFQEAFRVQSLSLEEGLSQSVVTRIIQDQDGYIWIATEDGLNRFDGYDFRVFQQEHNNPDSIHDSYIHQIIEAPGKGLWVGTQNGVSFFDKTTQKFTRIEDPQGDLQTAILSFGIPQSGNLFIGSENGLYLLNTQTQQVGPFTDEAGQVIDEEIVAIESFENRLWVATESCIFEVSEEPGQIVSLCDGELGFWLADKRVRRIIFKRGSLWIGTNNGLIRYDLVDKTLERFRSVQDDPDTLSSNWIQWMDFDEQNNLWIGTADGLNVYWYSEDRFQRYNYSASEREGLTANDIMSVYVDRDGLIWIGTYAAGVNILDPQQSGFKSLLSESNVAQFGSSNTVHSIVKDKDENLWLATYPGGVVKLDLMTGEVSRPFFTEASAVSDSFEYPYSLMVDINNRLWVGTFEGIFVIDLNSQKFLKAEVKLQGETVEFIPFVFQIYEDHSGVIWLATRDGLFQVEEYLVEESVITVSLLNIQQEVPYSFRDRSSRISTIIETRDGNMWFGGVSGLLRYSKQTEDWRHFEYHKGNEQSLSHDDVQVLFEDSRGILWVGTANGLNKVNRTDDDEVYFERITKEQGLPNNTIYGILEDNFKQLWLSTNLGLVRFSGQAESMQSFRRRDGLSSDEFNTAAYFADGDGLLYFGSINGVTVVDSRLLLDEPAKRKLLLSEVKIGDRQLDVYPLNQTSTPLIEKQKVESTLKISVTDLFYRKLGTQSYRYRLLGLDEDWVFLDKDRTFILAGLNEGKYIIDIQSRIGNEPWSKNNLRIDLIVTSSLWESEDIFYFSSGISVSLLLLLAYIFNRSYRARVAKAENRVKIESVRLKEVKKQNEELKYELEAKANELTLITDKLNEASQVVDSYQFRDSVSGFYRFQNIKHLLAEKRFKEEEKEFSLLAMIHISDLNEIKRKFGNVAAAEVTNQIATELKRQFSSDTYFCSVADDAFLILANSYKDKSLATRLIQARNRIVHSKYVVANDITVGSNIGLSYLDLLPQILDEADLLVTLSELLIAFHKKQNPRDKSGVLRIDVNRRLEEFKNLKANSDLVLVIEGNWLTGHFV
ncbi:diguanylate cyclase [Aliikangiella marina]|uniref:Diguanylate cyclase n=1 Tax=Aliikangiella marina TaxID=1712262 RepID=A0A545TJS4_9GAMM|nr:two-component regulator propeller domain-containing protein [Aliikangiella marina]TQV77472.1 diguanylate cyclase [Aliikangiella marina]